MISYLLILRRLEAVQIKVILVAEETRTSEEILAVISVLTRKLILFGILAVLMFSGVSADYYYSSSGIQG